MQFHLEMLEREHLARGLSPREARAAALRTFGGVTQMKETYREQRGLPLTETVIQDARYGVRTLVRTPGFTLAALVTLALGIGANSAIFSVVNAVLLQPLPYDGADRIVEMYRTVGPGYNRHSFKRFDYFKQHMESFEAFAGYRPTAFNLVAGGQAEHVSGTAVSHEYFRVLGGRPLYGRVFEPAEDVPNAPDVVVLRHDLWSRTFGEDPGILGTSILLGDRSFTVVGVMPDGFDRARTGDFYVPLQPGPMGPGSGFNYHIVARLAPGATCEQADAEGAPVFASFKASEPNANFGNEQAPRFLPLQESVSRASSPADHARGRRDAALDRLRQYREPAARESVRARP